MAQEVDIAEGQKPLADVVLCCTSLPQDVRNRVTSSAEEMGAVYKLDLTSDVTHLIVGNTATPKYRYVAKERPDIKVLHSDWIDAVRMVWMASEELHVGALEATHRLPTFYGLEICITGFGNPEERETIQDKVVAEGAKYHCDLTKVVTHLIAAVPEGKKFEAAKQWGLKVVSLKWYTDSLARGMALDESLYNPALPLEEQGKGAYRLRPKRTSLGKHGRDGAANGPGDGSKKKLRRTTSTRLESQSQDMWQDISIHSAGKEAADTNQWTDRDDRSTTAPLKDTSDRYNPAQEQQVVPADETQRLFSGVSILIHGFIDKRTTLLRNYLEPNGAHVVQTPAALEDASTNPFFKQRFLLVPHAISDPILKLPAVPDGTAVTTEWWVERCLHKKQLLDPSQDVLSRPLWFTDLSAFSKTSVCATGFEPLEYREIAEAVKLMGATYDVELLPTTSILVCAKQRKEKLQYAHKHRIPVVDVRWLWVCLETGEKAPLADYIVHYPHTISAGLANGGGDSSANSPASRDIQRLDFRGATKRKDEQSSTRLSNTRKTQNSPSLSLQSAKTAMPSRARKPQPFVHEDDDDEPPMIDEAMSPAPIKDQGSQMVTQPLQDVSPNRSPRKNCHTSDTLADTKNVVEPRTDVFEKPASLQPSTKQDEIDTKASIRPRPELEADISDLIRSAASRPNSASGLQKRKHRPLGRALSGMSNRSGSASNTLDRLSSAHLSDDLIEPALEDHASSRETLAPPSTQLGYETAEAEVHRLQMSKTMGTKFDDDEGFKRVASLGTVKDAVTTSSVGVGNRIKGRHRAK